MPQTDMPSGWFGSYLLGHIRGAIRRHRTTNQLESGYNPTHHQTIPLASPKRTRSLRARPAPAYARAPTPTEVVEEANGRIQLGLSRRDAALGKQTQTVEQRLGARPKSFRLGLSRFSSNWCRFFYRFFFGGGFGTLPK